MDRYIGNMITLNIGATDEFMSRSRLVSLSFLLVSFYFSQFFPFIINHFDKGLHPPSIVGWHKEEI